MSNTGFHRAGCCCKGGASTSCTEWGLSCFDGNELADPPLNPSDLPIVATYVPCDGAVDCAGKTGFGVDPLSFLTMDIDGPHGFEYWGAGGGFDFFLKCEAGVWLFEIFTQGVPREHCYGTVYPALVCGNAKYPTGTFNVTIYDSAKGTACGVMTVTFGP